MTDTKIVLRRDTCGECDGDGFTYHCDDYFETGECITGWDVPCDSCEGKGWIRYPHEVPDPKWAKLWKQINPKVKS